MRVTIAMPVHRRRVIAFETVSLASHFISLRMLVAWSVSLAAAAYVNYSTYVEIRYMFTNTTSRFYITNDGVNK